MSEKQITHALVRPPGDSFVNAISSARAPIDAGLARAEHREYCQALAAAGLIVEALPGDERYSDSCFVQDPAVVIRGQAILGRLSAPSRSGEEDAIAAWLKPRFPIKKIHAPGTFEGGDLLLLPDRVFVGASRRTNVAGIEQLTAMLAPLGISVTSVPVAGYLHLLTAVSYLGQNTMLATAAFASNPAFEDFEMIVVPAEEAYAANVIAIGENVIVPAAFPRTIAMLREHGLAIFPVSLSQFAAADGGATCLSLVW